MFEKLNIRIALIAAIMVGIFSLINFESLTKTATYMVISIILFYIFGSISQNYLNKSIEKIKEEEKQAEENKENEEIEMDEEVEAEV